LGDNEKFLSKPKVLQIKQKLKIENKEDKFLYYLLSEGFMWFSTWNWVSHFFMWKKINN